jgi:acyl transferase domain-containing protein
VIHLLGLDGTTPEPSLDYQGYVKGEVDQSCSMSGQPLMIPMLSTRMGRKVEKADLNAEYWEENCVEPESVVHATRVAADLGVQMLLELSPPIAGATRPELRLTNNDVTLSIVHSFANARGSSSLASALGELYVRGSRIKWEEVFSRKVPPINIPIYPFKGEKATARSRFTSVE